MEYKDFFINKMRESEELRIYLMAHNTEWYHFDIINQSEDLDPGFERIYIHGRKTLINKQLKNGNFDLFLSFDYDEYDEYHEKELLEESIKMAIKEQKNVTYGYEYYIPDCERTINSSFRKINIGTIDKEGKVIFETTIFAEMHSSALKLANIVSFNHFEQISKGMELKKQ